MEAPLSFSKGVVMNPENPSPSSPSPTSSRLWKPVAQRNLRNQWSKMLSSKNRWVSAASDGRSHATSLVNAYLSQRYMPEMDLGVLKNMPGIRQKAREKLSQKQELCCSRLLSSYKEMVVASCHLVKASSSMRCFVKGSAVSPLVQFSDHPEDRNDSGDGGGIPVFSSFTVSHFENLAEDIVEMFVLELSLKVYLTTWLADVNIDMNRINELFSLVEEEMQVKLS